MYVIHFGGCIFIWGVFFLEAVIRLGVVFSFWGVFFLEAVIRLGGVFSFWGAVFKFLGCLFGGCHSLGGVFFLGGSNFQAVKAFGEMVISFGGVLSLGYVFPFVGVVSYWRAQFLRCQRFLVAN